jgi:hypothetical protein
MLAADGPNGIGSQHAWARTQVIGRPSAHSRRRRTISCRSESRASRGRGSPRVNVRNCRLACCRTHMPLSWCIRPHEIRRYARLR